VCIYEKGKRANKYELIIKTEALKTKLFRLFNFGYFFGYSTDQNGTEIITFVNDEKSSNKEIEGVPIWPERVFVSFCETYQIYVYDGYFIIYRVDENGQLSYFRSIQETVKMLSCRFTKECFGKSSFSFPQGVQSFSCR
jgi:hypothetical protein